MTLYISKLIWFQFFFISIDSKFSQFHAAYVCIYPTPLQEQDATQGQFL